MHAHRVPLVACDCFVFDSLWCNISEAAPCQADSERSTMCRLPLSIHKLASFGWDRAAAVYERWWAFVSGRERKALRDLDEWEADALARGGHRNSPVAAASKAKDDGKF